MKTIRTMLIAAASVVAAAGAYAQSASDGKAEMNRGVPGVDVDVGRNANGAIDVTRSNSETARGVPGVDVDTGRNANGAVDVNTSRSQSDTANETSRPARADRG